MSDDEITAVTRIATGPKKRPKSERSVYAIQEFLKLRRLTRDQFARLMCKRSADAAYWPLYRLQTGGLVTVDYTPIGRRDEAIIKLTENGHRQAAVSLSRAHEEHYRDQVSIEFMAHQLVINDLYLEIVAQGASTWSAIRQNASLFEWRASNDDSTVRWKGVGEFNGKDPNRRVDPDVTIETETHRYLVEVERPTKTQDVVARKVERYSNLFSPNRSGQGASGYAQKYPDAKKAVVVFAFTTERRAINARAHFERRAQSPLGGFHIPNWRCGTVEQMGEMLRRELLGRAAPAPKEAANGDLVAQYGAAILQFAHHMTTQVERTRQQLQDHKAVSMPEWPSSLPQINSLVALLKARKQLGSAT